MKNLKVLIEKVIEKNASANWLRQFDEPIDNLIARELKKVNNSPLTYDPYNFTEWLESAAERLDVCLVRRRDAMDLLDRAIRQYIAYKHFEETRTQDDILEANSIQTEQQRHIKDAAHKAQAAINGISGDVAKAIKATAEGAFNAARLSETQEIAKGAAFTNRATSQKKMNELIRDFSETPGHPFNYYDRVSRVFSLLVGDVTEAYQKLASVSAGLKLVWNEDIPLPAPFDVHDKPQRAVGGWLEWKAGNVLDAMVVFTREAARRIELREASEIVVNVSIPLFNNYSHDGASDPNKLIPQTVGDISGGAKDDGKGEATFTIAENAFPHLTSVRVLAIGASVDVHENGSADVDQDYASARNSKRSRELHRLAIDVPQQPTEGAITAAAINATFPKRTIHLGSVTYLPEAQLPSLVSAPAILNTSPFGKWSIKLFRGISSPRSVRRLRQEISNVNIHLKIAATVARRAAE